MVSGPLNHSIQWNTSIAFYKLLVQVESMKILHTGSENPMTGILQQFPCCCVILAMTCIWWGAGQDTFEHQIYYLARTMTSSNKEWGINSKIGSKGSGNTSSHNFQWSKQQRIILFLKQLSDNHAYFCQKSK